MTEKVCLGEQVTVYQPEEGIPVTLGSGGWGGLEKHCFALLL